MRRTRNIRSPIRDVYGRIPIGICSKATGITPKHLFPSEAVCRSTARAGGASVWWSDRADRDANERSQQCHASTKEASGMGFPSYQSFRVFNCNASSRALSYEHNTAGFIGQQLPLGTGFNAPVDAAPLVHGTTVTLSFQNRAQVWPSVPIGSSHTRPNTNINTNKCRGGGDLWQRDRNGNAAVPLPIFAEDFALLTQRGPRQCKCTIDSPMFLSGDIKAPLILISTRSLYQNPEVKTLCRTWGLHLCCVDQFCLQRTGVIAGFPSSAPISIGPPICFIDESAQALGRGASALLTKRGCARRVMPRKEGRQERQRVRFSACWIKLELVTESYGVHKNIVTKTGPLYKRPQPYLSDRID